MIFERLENSLQPQDYKTEAMNAQTGIRHKVLLGTRAGGIKEVLKCFHVNSESVRKALFKELNTLNELVCPLLPLTYLSVPVRAHSIAYRTTGTL